MGAHIIVYDNAFAAVFHSGSLQIEALYVHCAPRGNQHQVGVYRSFFSFPVEGHGALAIVLGNRSHGALQIERHAALLHALAQALGNVSIKCRQTFLEKLYHGYFAAKGLEGRGKLHAYDARSYDAQPAGQVLGLEQCAACDDVRALGVHRFGRYALNGRQF